MSTLVILSEYMCIHDLVTIVELKTLVWAASLTLSTLKVWLVVH